MYLMCVYAYVCMIYIYQIVLQILDKNRCIALHTKMWTSPLSFTIVIFVDHNSLPSSQRATTFSSEIL
jgi:hypothetical protein